ncbi:N-acylethanolamine-hydrolyzing acid amidase-like [Ciona intestinalis]
MKQSIFCLTLLVLRFVIVEAIVHKNEQKRFLPKRHVLNLDLPPYERWNHILDQHDVSYIYKALHKLMNVYLGSKSFIPILQEAAVKLLPYLSQPYADELKGISNHTGLSLGDVILGNIVYDVTAFNRTNFHLTSLLSGGGTGLLSSLGLSGSKILSSLGGSNLLSTLKNKGSSILSSLGSSGANGSSLLGGLKNLKLCTSIVAMDKNNRMIHARNMDYATIHEYLKRLTIEVDFQKNGQTVFTGTTFVGFIGITTGYRRGAYTVSGDQRNVGKITQNIQSFFKGGEFAFFQLRTVLEKERTFHSALSSLVRTRTVGGVYFILGGVRPGEGVVIVRSQKEAIGVVGIPRDGWYVLETNYDPWNPAPAADNRRGAAIKMLNKIGKNRISSLKLFEVLSTPPVFNFDTTYTVIMQADKGKYSTLIRYDAPKRTRPTSNTTHV